MELWAGVACNHALRVSRGACPNRIIVLLMKKTSVIITFRAMTMSIRTIKAMTMRAMMMRNRGIGLRTTTRIMRIRAWD